MNKRQGRELPLNRQEAVLLLKELASVCGSFRDALSVSIEKDMEKNSWELHVSCAPNPSEFECIEKILFNHGLEMVTVNRYCVFRSRK